MACYPLPPLLVALLAACLVVSSLAASPLYCTCALGFVATGLPVFECFLAKRNSSELLKHQQVGEKDQTSPLYASPESNSERASTAIQDSTGNDQNEQSCHVTTDRTWILMTTKSNWLVVLWKNKQHSQKNFFINLNLNYYGWFTDIWFHLNLLHMTHNSNHKSMIWKVLVLGGSLSMPSFRRKAHSAVLSTMKSLR